LHIISKLIKILDFKVVKLLRSIIGRLVLKLQLVEKNARFPVLPPVSDIIHFYGSGEISCILCQSYFDTVPN
jgi:hypothetical protein